LRFKYRSQMSQLTVTHPKSGDAGYFTDDELVKTACDKPYAAQFTHPELRELLLRVAGEGGKVSGKRLGKFLSKISGRVVSGFRLEMRPDRSHGNRFSLRPAAKASAHTNGGLGAIEGQFQQLL